MLQRNTNLQNKMPTVETPRYPVQLIQVLSCLDALNIAEFDRLYEAFRQQQNHDAVKPAETALLRQINEGLSETERQRYGVLHAKMQRGTISETEHAEMKALAMREENLKAARLQALVALPALRGTSVPAFIEVLGL
jgi:hypothetical protein